MDKTNDSADEVNYEYHMRNSKMKRVPPIEIDPADIVEGNFSPQSPLRTSKTNNLNNALLKPAFVKGGKTLKKKKLSVDLSNELKKCDSTDLLDSTPSQQVHRRSPNLIKLEENVRNLDNLDFSLINEPTEGAIQHNKSISPPLKETKKDKDSKKKSKIPAIDVFDEGEFKKAFELMNSRNTGEGKTFDER